jgi:hypothetical protein
MQAKERGNMDVRIALAVCSLSFLASPLLAQTPEAAGTDTALLTIYNQNFAVVRSSVDLDLKPGVTEVTTTKVTRQLEPDSVVLRDVKSGKEINIIEQNYDSAVITQNRLLEKFEGQTIDFRNQVYRDNSTIETDTAGKIVRAPEDGGQQPIVEVNGKLEFVLPGTPIFPAQADSLLLKPTLRWRIAAEQAETIHSELDYITIGLSWQATYNLVLPEHSAGTTSPADVVGWVTIENNSGTEFPEASIKLMAGDVAKIQAISAMDRFAGGLKKMDQVAPVTQKAFDDFHLYDLHRVVDLRDGETKQVEFLRAGRVPVTRRYEYDGMDGMSSEGLNTNRDAGTFSSNKVTIVQTFKNSEGNHLGIPLPAGKIRFYRQDTDGQVEFTGESTIDHTPKDGTIRVVTGDAFDVTGSRKQTDFHVDSRARTMDESFAITLKNAKDEAVTVDAIERLFRWSNARVTAHSSDFSKEDSRTIRFPVELAANQEKTVTYTVHYSW